MPTALVLGSATTLRADVKACLELFTPDAWIACNNTGRDWEGHLDHWASLHIDPTNDWVGLERARQQRVRAGRNNPVTWSHKLGKGVDRWTTDWGGSTGLFAVKVMIELGFDQIVLAGVPMTKNDGHYYDHKQWAQAEKYHKNWLKHLNEFAPYTRSISGWTRELLGAP